MKRYIKAAVRALANPAILALVAAVLVAGVTLLILPPGSMTVAVAVDEPVASQDEAFTAQYVAFAAPEPTPIVNERIVTPRVIADEPELVSLGEFKLYHYCPCKRCCGANAQGITSTGTVATAGRTISVDPDVIPLGTTVYIDGQAYIAEDTGSGITGNVVDIFMDEHEAARDAGVKYAEIFVEVTP